MSADFQTLISSIDSALVSASTQKFDADFESSFVISVKKLAKLIRDVPNEADINKIIAQKIPFFEFISLVHRFYLFDPYQPNSFLSPSNYHRVSGWLLQVLCEVLFHMPIFVLLLTLGGRPPFQVIGQLSSSDPLSKSPSRVSPVVLELWVQMIALITQKIELNPVIVNVLSQLTDVYSNIRTFEEFQAVIGASNDTSFSFPTNTSPYSIICSSNFVRNDNYSVIFSSIQRIFEKIFGSLVFQLCNCQAKQINSIPNLDGYDPKFRLNYVVLYPEVAQSSQLLQSPTQDTMASDRTLNRIKVMSIIVNGLLRTHDRARGREWKQAASSFNNAWLALSFAVNPREFIESNSQVLIIPPHYQNRCPPSPFQGDSSSSLGDVWMQVSTEKETDLLQYFDIKSNTSPIPTFGDSQIPVVSASLAERCIVRLVHQLRTIISRMNPFSPGATYIPPSYFHTIHDAIIKDVPPSGPFSPVSSWNSIISYLFSLDTSPSAVPSNMSTSQYQLCVKELERDLMTVRFFSRFAQRMIPSLSVHSAQRKVLDQDMATSVVPHVREQCGLSPSLLSAWFSSFFEACFIAYGPFLPLGHSQPRSSGTSAPSMTSNSMLEITLQTPLAPLQELRSFIRPNGFLLEVSRSLLRRPSVLVDPGANNTEQISRTDDPVAIRSIENVLSTLLSNPSSAFTALIGVSLLSGHPETQKASSRNPSVQSSTLIPLAKWALKALNSHLKGSIVLDASEPLSCSLESCLRLWASTGVRAHSAAARTAKLSVENAVSSGTPLNSSVASLELGLTSPPPKPPLHSASPALSVPGGTAASTTGASSANLISSNNPVEGLSLRVISSVESDLASILECLPGLLRAAMATASLSQRNAMLTELLNVCCESASERIAVFSLAAPALAAVVRVPSVAEAVVDALLSLFLSSSDMSQTVGRILAVVFPTVGNHVIFRAMARLGILKPAVNESSLPDEESHDASTFLHFFSSSALPTLVSSLLESLPLSPQGPNSALDVVSASCAKMTVSVLENVCSLWDPAPFSTANLVEPHLSLLHAALRLAESLLLGVHSSSVAQASGSPEKQKQSCESGVSTRLWCLSSPTERELRDAAVSLNSRLISSVLPPLLSSSSPRNVSTSLLFSVMRITLRTAMLTPRPATLASPLMSIIPNLESSLSSGSIHPTDVGELLLLLSDAAVACWTRALPSSGGTKADMEHARPAVRECFSFLNRLSPIFRDLVSNVGASLTAGVVRALADASKGLDSAEALEGFISKSVAFVSGQSVGSSGESSSLHTGSTAFARAVVAAHLVRRAQRSVSALNVLNSYSESGEFSIDINTKETKRSTCSWGILNISTTLNSSGSIPHYFLD